MPSEAVCTLIHGPGDAVLAVSRPLNWSDLGLPGGSVEAVDGDLSLDRDAALRNAAARELREECGLRIDPRALHPVFEHKVGERRVTTFAPRGPVDLSALRLGVGAEGRVCWSTPQALCAGTYGAYNLALFEALGTDRKSTRLNSSHSSVSRMPSSA